MYELEDVWINAISALPDAKPLADLLRSDTPIPPGAGDWLAELLSPRKPEIYGGKLVYKETDSLEKVMGNSFHIAAEHAKRLSEGKSSEDAAFDVADSRNMSARQVLRYKRAWKQFVSRLHGNR